MDQINCSVCVDYNKSLEQMIEMGKYDDIDESIEASNFPIQKTGIAVCDLTLIQFDDVITDDTRAKEALDRMVLRPATLPELLALGEQHPNLQLQFPIVALGSRAFNISDTANIPCLNSRGNERVLILDQTELGWAECTHFAAVHKESQNGGTHDKDKG